MSTMDAATVAHAIYDAFNRGDVEAALALATADVEIVNVGWNVTYRGHDGFREFMQGWKTLDPNARVRVVRQLAGPDGVTNEAVFEATHVGPLRTPAGEIAPTGKTIALPICEVWHVRDGKLTSLHNYADGVTIMAQLGLLPPPA
jgi:steroid delta-isomerase-like uncharacterized protein